MVSNAPRSERRNQQTKRGLASCRIFPNEIRAPQSLRNGGRLQSVDSPHTDALVVTGGDEAAILIAESYGVHRPQVLIVLLSDVPSVHVPLHNLLVRAPSLGDNQTQTIPKPSAMLQRMSILDTSQRGTCDTTCIYKHLDSLSNRELFYRTYMETNHL